MVENCTRHGIPPLSRQDFDAENTRMYVEMVRRRRGDMTSSYNRGTYY